MRNIPDAAVAVDWEKIAELEAERAVIAGTLRTDNLSRFDELRQNGTGSIGDKAELAVLAFNLGELTLAEELVDDLRLEDSGNPVWTAYKGSLESMKGDGAPVVAAVQAVETGFRYLDEAVALTDGTLDKTESGAADAAMIDQRTTALINRGSTAKAVPNEVFIKALQGAHDYLET